MRSEEKGDNGDVTVAKTLSKTFSPPQNPQNPQNPRMLKNRCDVDAAVVKAAEIFYRSCVCIFIQYVIYLFIFVY